MSEFLKDLAIALISSLSTVLLETAVEALKEKAPCKTPGKHYKRP